MYPLRPPANLTTSTAGAWAELVASEILLTLGFEVYRNLSQKGEHDLVILWPDSLECLPVDITLGTWALKPDGTKRLDSAASTKLASKKKACVLVVTTDRELFLPVYDTSVILYEGSRPYRLIYKPFSVVEFLQRVS